MSHLPTKIEALGRRESTSVATATNQRVFASLSDLAPSNRQGVSLTNLDGASELWVGIAVTGATPSLSASDLDLVVPPRATRQLALGPGLEVWVRASATTAVAYSALELR